jgi:hypothetical protein
MHYLKLLLILKLEAAKGVRELYELLGGAKYFPKEVQERAQYTMGLIMYRNFFDALTKTL